VGESAQAPASRDESEDITPIIGDDMRMGSEVAGAWRSGVYHVDGVVAIVGR
jgi:hypothetical protein